MGWGSEQALVSWADAPQCSGGGQTKLGRQAKEQSEQDSASGSTDIELSMLIIVGIISKLSLRLYNGASRIMALEEVSGWLDLSHMPTPSCQGI